MDTAVTLKLPTYWDAHAAVWFAQADSQFALRGGVSPMVKISCQSDQTVAEQIAQAKSRRMPTCVCPYADGKCFDYRWKSGPWVGTERTVWCQRSDGINVTGGCFPPAEPTKLRTCQPACTVPYSICLEGEHCVCEDGFLGVLSPGGVLEACMRGEESEGIFLGIPEGFGETTSQGQGAGVLKTWSMEPFDAEGKLKAWVYGIAVAGFVLFIFIISMTCFACKRLKAPLRKAMKKTSPNRTASYDGDLDLRNWPSLLSPGCG
uniref:thrombospondin type-1 domain-containing protein 7A-like n=1 Tax=Myxine glutinosa TaxID=7769 RepID=UPI00358FA6F3